MTQYVRGWFGWLFVLGMVGATSIVSLPAVATIPNALQPCIPRRQVARAEMVGSTQVQGKTYYLLAAYEQGDSVASDLVIAVRNGRCEQSLYNPMGDPIALSSRIPQAAARQLTLQRYQREIKRIGRRAFVQQVNQSRKFNASRSDEEAWALKQLGL